MSFIEKQTRQNMRALSLIKQMLFVIALVSAFSPKLACADDDDISIKKGKVLTVEKGIEKINVEKMDDYQALMKLLLDKDMTVIHNYREQVIANDKELVALQGQLVKLDEQIAAKNARLPGLKSDNMPEYLRQGELAEVDKDLKEMLRKRGNLQHDIRSALNKYPDPVEKIAYAEKVVADKLVAFREGGYIKLKSMPPLSLLPGDEALVVGGTGMTINGPNKINKFLWKWGQQDAESAYKQGAKEAALFAKRLVGSAFPAVAGAAVIGASIVSGSSSASASTSVKPAGVPEIDERVDPSAEDRSPAEANQAN